MDNLPLISLIVPVYNMMGLLEKCMEGVLAQTYPRLEIILVDDGATDGSGALCDAYAESDSRVLAVHRENGGLSAAKNTGLLHATGEYVTFVDADDRIEPDYTQTLYDLCIRHQVPLAACNHHIIYPRQRSTRFPVGEEECTLEAPEALENVCYQQKPDVSSWGKLYAASLFDGLRFPEGQIYEDTAVFADIMLRAGRMAYTPRPLYHYILRSDSLSHGAYNRTRMDYIASVRRLCDTLQSQYPQLEQAALCRRVFAALSVRRYLVGCAKEHKPVRKELESYVKKNARTVLGDPRVPKRDKIAVLAVLTGPWVYDLLWRVYAGRRG